MHNFLFCLRASIFNIAKLTAFVQWNVVSVFFIVFVQHFFYICYSFCFTSITSNGNVCHLWLRCKIRKFFRSTNWFELDIRCALNYSIIGGKNKWTTDVRKNTSLILFSMHSCTMSLHLLYLSCFFNGTLQQLKQIGHLFYNSIWCYTGQFIFIVYLLDYSAIQLAKEWSVFPE